MKKFTYTLTPEDVYDALVLALCVKPLAKKYEVVGFRPPKAKDTYIATSGLMTQATADWNLETPRLILGPRKPGMPEPFTVTTTVGDVYGKEYADTLPVLHSTFSYRLAANCVQAVFRIPKDDEFYIHPRYLIPATGRCEEPRLIIDRKEVA